MDLNAQTHSAVPFGNAILYVDYVMKNGPLEWTVVQFENGTKQNLRSGICLSLIHIFGLAIIIKMISELFDTVKVFLTF